MYFASKFGALREFVAIASRQLNNFNLRIVSKGDLIGGPLIGGLTDKGLLVVHQMDIHIQEYREHTTLLNEAPVLLELGHEENYI